MRLLPCGDAALLAELDDLSDVLALRSAIDAERDGGGLTEVIDQSAPVTWASRIRGKSTWL